MTDRRNTWTEAMDAVLSRLWAEGHVASAIGREMGRSKNAIVGRCHRLHLPPRPSPIPGHVPASAPALPTATPPPVAPVPLPPPVIVAPVPLPTSSPAMPTSTPRLPGVRACQYPFGHPKERGFRFCGAAVDGGVYCREHMALCYGTHRVAA